jgi:nitroreductase
MINRRSLIVGAAGLAGAAALWEGFAHLRAVAAYNRAAQVDRAPLRADGGTKELIRFATLAANSHNTQPWRFAVAERRIVIAPDYSRRLRAVDPDDHHLFVSLGCATENLVHAAAAMGLAATPSFESDAVAIELEKAPSERSVLFDAIPRRQSTRALYDGQPVSNETLRLLDKVGEGNRVSILVISEPTKIGNVIDYVVEANTAQMRDRAFLDELQLWMRFNAADALATRDGLYAPASGNPALPGWLARSLLPIVFNERDENDKYRAQIRSSAGIVVFVADRSEKPHWIDVGRACQRFALQATALGLKCAFVNQPIEAPLVRRQFASYLGLGERLPDIVMRFGVGPELPPSLRRSVEDVGG